MVAQAMSPSTNDSVSHTADKSSVRWTWRHSVLSIILGADAAYIAIIISGMAWSPSPDDRIMPHVLSHILVAALAVATAVAAVLVVEGRIKGRQDEQFLIICVQLAEIKAAISSAPAPRPRTRRWDEPTVPNVANGARVYAVASVHTGQRDALLRQVVGEARDQLAEMIEEYGKRREWRGYTRCMKDGLAGVGDTTSSVVPMPPRNGRSH